MKKVYQVENVHCRSCANVIKGALEDDFGVIEINLEKSPVEITLNLEEEDSTNFKEEISDLGYSVIGEVSAK